MAKPYHKWCRHCEPFLPETDREQAFLEPALEVYINCYVTQLSAYWPVHQLWYHGNSGRQSSHSNFCIRVMPPAVVSFEAGEAYEGSKPPNVLKQTAPQSRDAALVESTFIANRRDGCSYKSNYFDARCIATDGARSIPSFSASNAFLS